MQYLKYLYECTQRYNRKEQYMLHPYCSADFESGGANAQRERPAMRSRRVSSYAFRLLLPFMSARRGVSAFAAPSGPQSAAPVLRLGRSDVPATASVLLLHGLGDSAEGIRGIVPLMAKAVPHARFVLPTAPIRPITMNGGFPMTGWYDIVGLNERENEAGALDLSCPIVGGNRWRLGLILFLPHIPFWGGLG
eukprot:scaffold7092_cov262-Pinguiococcus_pyrenoidosus.AAC.37